MFFAVRWQLFDARSKASTAMCCTCVGAKTFQNKEFLKPPAPPQRAEEALAMRVGSAQAVSVCWVRPY